MKMLGARQSVKWLSGGLLLSILIGSAFAQGAQKTTPATGAAKPAAPAASTQPVPSEQAVYLVRSTLMTLNDANRSGNYSVLRDLAAPEFTRNNPADLAAAFVDLRRRRVDLFAVALLNPMFDQPIALDKNGRLHLAGHFPTSPLQIKFDLLYSNTGGQWRLFAISVATPPAAPPPSTPTQKPATPTPTPRR